LSSPVNKFIFFIFFLDRRKSLPRKDLGRRGLPRRRNPLRHKDLRQIEKNAGGFRSPLTLIPAWPPPIGSIANIQTCIFHNNNATTR